MSRKRADVDQLAFVGIRTAEEQEMVTSLALWVERVGETYDVQGLERPT